MSSNKRKLRWQASRRNVKKFFESVDESMEQETCFQSADECYEMLPVHNEHSTSELCDGAVGFDMVSGCLSKSLDTNKHEEDEDSDSCWAALSNISSASTPCNDDITSSDSSFEDNDRPDLCSDLAKWACEFNVSHAAVNGLLTVLKSQSLSVPSTAKTLLKTPRTSNVLLKSGGEYIYLGLDCSIMKYLASVPENLMTDLTQLDLSINIDGLPLFKSSPISLWPILVMICNVKPSVPFVVSLYCGTKKPCNLDFLQDLINDMKHLMANGLSYNDKHFTVKLHSVICDAPAKAFVKGIIQFNGSYGCDKCWQKGHYDGRMLFLDNDAPKRTDESFRQQKNSAHHKTLSPFCELAIDMVQDFPCDYMHQVNLGVTRRLLLAWTSGSLKCRLTSSQIACISKKMEDIGQFIPSMFARKPRSFQYIRMWKATEYRQFLMYSGQFVLKDVLSKKLYQHFMKLCVGICILMNENLVTKYGHDADNMLREFVSDSRAIYGDKFVVYNVHSLVHLYDSAKRYRSLENCSAYSFENYLHKLKTLIRSPRKPLVQAVRRLHELDVNLPGQCDLHNCMDLHISNKSPDNCYILNSGKYCLCHNILPGSKEVLCEVFIHTQSLVNSLCSFSFPRLFCSAKRCFQPSII